MFKAFAIDAARSQRLLREINAAETKIFANVADEVGQLERDAEIDGMGSKRVPWDGLIRASEDRKHLQADHGRGTPCVAGQLLIRVVFGDAEIHPHRIEKVAEVTDWDVPAADRVDDREAYRIGRVSALDIGQEFFAPRHKSSLPPALLAGVRVDDVVGVARESVQGVDITAFGGW